MKDFRDILKVEGILFKGFGIIPKFIMLDTDLSIDSKAIYLYFCSFAGSGDTAFPSRDKIRKDLKISKDAYYKHYNDLIKEGYLKVEQSMYKDEKTNQIRKGKNIYTLVVNPKKFEEQKILSKKKNNYSTVKFTAMKSYGYGTIPKAIMIDPILHRKSKAVYGYFASFSGNVNSAFPELKNILYHLQISEKTYYKYFNELVELNYITPVQRHIEGRLSVNDYYLNELPNEALTTNEKVIHIERNDEIQVGKKQDTEKSIDIKPSSQVSKKQDTEKNINNEIQVSKKQDTQKQDIQKQDIQKQDTVTNNSSNINSIYYNQSINQQEKRRLTDRLNKEELEKEILKTLKEEKTIPYHYMGKPLKMDIAIKLLTEYKSQLNWFKENETIADEVYFSIFKLFNEALIEMLTTQEMMILNNAHITYAKVYERLVEQIDINDKYISIGWVMDNAINDYKTASLNNDIRNPVKYMKAVIWNCLISGNVKTVTEVKRYFG